MHIYGIRHHGPGSARSLRQALEELQPDIILVEGPPDAQEVLPLLAHAEMQPPVALLVYAPERTEHAAYYPFAIFSPEWQAIHYGLSRNIPVRFMDLPQAHQVPPLPKAEEVTASVPNEPAAQPDNAAASATEPPIEPEAAADATAEQTPPFDPRRDPLRWIAEAAGYNDSERWWDHMVEHRRDSTDLFAAILEAMTVLREAVEEAEREAMNTIEPQPVASPDAAPAPASGDANSAEPLTTHYSPLTQHQAQREAWMRQTMRAAEREGFQRIAVVCGAWHAPALAKMPPAKEDAALLKNLPKTKVQATWVPWTYGRLCFASGYGAGIESPGWYHHLWTSKDHLAIRWMARVAALLREQDLDASSAHVIEAVRLAESLAALRDRPLPGLPELNEAVQAILCFGSDLPLRLIHEKLIVSETIGQVPEETPMVPLQQDLMREQKRLRLPPEASQKSFDLDLRKPNDLDRSHLLHRLGLLGVPWGRLQHSSGGKGTFHEIWQTQWQPEFSIRIIEVSVWGNTVSEAATGRVRELADKAPDLPALTELLSRVMLASLPAASSHVMQRLEAAAALASDVAHLMDALPALSNVLRYGDVRQTNVGMVGHIVDGLVARICIGLPLACASLDEEAAEAMCKRINQVQGAIALLQNPEHTAVWNETLKGLAEKGNLHGLIAGRCSRILLDAGVFQTEEAARRMSLALSTANEPAQAAAWVEGFLQGSGMLLLHDEKLWQVLDDWVLSLTVEVFTQLLPLLRRTFATFTPPERRQMGERVRDQKPTMRSARAMMAADFDTARAEAVLPLVARLLGVTTA